jgi:hypothetical protein
MNGFARSCAMTASYSMPFQSYVLLRGRNCRGFALPQLVDLERRHVAAVVTDDVNEPELRNGGLHLVVIEGVNVRVVFHDPTRVPIPAVPPEIERITVGRVIRFRPADEIDQRLGITEVSLAPVGHGMRRIGNDALRDVIELRCLPVAAARVVAGSTIGQCDDLDVGVGTGETQFLLDVLDDVILEVVVSRHVNHDRPAGGDRRGMRDIHKNAGQHDSDC